MSNRTIEAIVRLSAKLGPMAAFGQLGTKLADVNRKAAAVNRTQTMIAKSSTAATAALMRYAAPAAITYGAVSAGRAFATIERRLERIGINADASSAQMQTAFQQMRTIADDVKAPVDNVVSGLESLIASGKSLDEAMSLLPKVAAAAQASDSEFAAMATTADAITGSFGIAADQMGVAFDIIAKAGKAGKFELKDMAAELPSLAPAFAALGYRGGEGLKKLAAALQVVRMETGTSGEAATSFMDVLTKMNSVTVSNNFKKQFGVNIRREMEKAKKAGEDTLMAFIRLSKEAIDGDLSKIPLLFTDKQMQIAMRALINRTGEYTSQLNALGNAAGTVQGDIDRLATNTQASIDKMANSWDRLKTSIGGTIAPTASAGMDAVSNTIENQAAMDRGFAKMGMGFFESRFWSMMNAGNPEALKSVFWLGGGRTEWDKKRIAGYRQGADARIGADTPNLPDGVSYQERGLPETGPVIRTRDGKLLSVSEAAAASAPVPAARPSEFEMELARQEAARARSDVRTEAYVAARTPLAVPADADGNISLRPNQRVDELEGLLEKIDQAGSQSGADLAQGGRDAAEAVKASGDDIARGGQDAAAAIRDAGASIAAQIRAAISGAFGSGSSAPVSGNRGRTMPQAGQAGRAQ